MLLLSNSAAQLRCSITSVCSRLSAARSSRVEIHAVAAALHCSLTRDTPAYHNSGLSPVSSPRASLDHTACLGHGTNVSSSTGICTRSASIHSPLCS